MDSTQQTIDILELHYSMARYMNDFLSKGIVQGKDLVMLDLLRSNGIGNPAKLSQELGLTSGRITNILNSLAKDGLVSKKKNRQDARKITVTLTQKGYAEANDLRNRMISTHDEIARKLGKHDTSELIRIICKLVDSPEH